MTIHYAFCKKKKIVITLFHAHLTCSCEIGLQNSYKYNSWNPCVCVYKVCVCVCVCEVEFDSISLISSLHNMNFSLISLYFFPPTIWRTMVKFGNYFIIHIKITEILLNWFNSFWSFTFPCRAFKSLPYWVRQIAGPFLLWLPCDVFPLKYREKRC